MNNNILQKKIPFFNASLSYLYFKNIAASDFQEFSESLNELFYNENSSPISVFICGSLKNQKLWNKTHQQVFDEINWITTWFHSTETEKHVSGYFTVVGGTNLKSLVSDHFICKVFDTVDARFCYLGEVRSSAKKEPILEEWNQVQLTMNKAMQWCGLERTNLIKQQFLINNSVTISTIQSLTEPHLFSNSGVPMQLFETENQQLVAILGAAFAIKPNQEVAISELQISKDSIPLLGDEACQILISSQSMDYIQLLNVSNHFIKKDSNSEVQINQMLQTISEWLESKALNWNQLCRGIAYFKDEEGIKTFKNLCKERKIPLSNILTVNRTLKSEVPVFAFEVDFVRIK